jgi:hypothetical protein
MRLLLISNSTNPGEKFLGYPGEAIKTFLGEKSINVRVFRKGSSPAEFGASDDLSFLLHQ